MRIQPRQHILDIWRSVVAASYRDGTWQWGGRDEPNSISDAEQLLCLLYPATEIESLSLDRPDAMSDDVLSIMRPLGDGMRIPRTVIEALASYVERYTGEDGEPMFGGGSYLRTSRASEKPDSEVTPTDRQFEIGIVDSYSMSLTLCLSALGFIKVFMPQAERRAEQKARVLRLQEAFSKRLTAAMVGLLRSFVVSTVEPDEPAGRAIIGMVNQEGLPPAVIQNRLRERLVRVRSRLRDYVRIGLGSDIELDNENLLFECGWTWGMSRDAEPIEFVETDFATRQGYADPRPYLYFTVVALDGINDLRSTRTRELGLLTEDQWRLAEALQIRWDMTQRYWSTMARFGGQRWPLEDIPWRTSDGDESDYYSLLVSAVLVQDLINRQATDDDLTRAVDIFAALARRGRITRRETKDDPAVAMHVPGVSMSLTGIEEVGPPLYWNVADFAPVLLKRSLDAAGLSANVGARDQLLAVAEAAMDHLHLRRLGDGAGAGLWDDPWSVFKPPPDHEADTRPSWYLTERVIEGLVAAARTFEQPPLRSSRLIGYAVDLLSEANHLLSQEMLEADVEDDSPVRIGLERIEARLNRARKIMTERPATANALTLEALRELDELAVARLDAARSV